MRLEGSSPRQGIPFPVCITVFYTLVVNSGEILMRLLLLAGVLGTNTASDASPLYSRHTYCLPNGINIITYED
jgi:hypothetical protein